jgi:hypothetical protein
MPIKLLLAIGLIAATTGGCTAYYPSTAYNGYYYRSGYYSTYPGYYAYRPASYYSPQVAYVYM